MAKNKFINLLPQEEFETTTVGRTLRWAMTSFRVIVIVTETFVMGGFLSRFWLDQQRGDLDDLIKTKSAQISAQSEFEKDFRGIQRKLAIVKGITDLPKSSTHVGAIASKIPPDVVLSSISLEDTAASLRGVAASETGISQFIANLKSEPSFKSVDLTQAGTSFDDPTATIFSINISY